jgi:hypothetical protein
MDRVFEDDKEIVMEKWNTLIGGVPVTFEMRWKARKSAEADSVGKDSWVEATWVSAACVPVMSEDGTLKSIAGFTTDISAQKNSEQHMLEKANALCALKLVSKDLLVSLNHVGVTTRHAKQFQRVQYCGSEDRNPSK